MAEPEALKGKLRLPVIGAPLFIISNPDLVLAQCKAGIVGSFPALNARPVSQLDEWLDRITSELDSYNRANPDKPAAPFAVNQIVHRSNARLEEDMALCEKYKVPVVITSLGAREDVNTAVKSWGGITLHDVINQRFAHKAIEKGATGLICVSAGAGGHAGSLPPFGFVAETREWFDGPILCSGSIGTGGGVLAAQAMGADYAYIGSAFIATEEARADEAYKQGIVEGSAEDIVYTNLFTGVHGNYLRKSIVDAGLDPDDLPESDPSKMDFGSGGGSKAKAWKDIWGSGQGIGAVKAVRPAAEFIAQLPATILFSRLTAPPAQIGQGKQVEAGDHQQDQRHQCRQADGKRQAFAAQPGDIDDDIGKYQRGEGDRQPAMALANERAEFHGVSFMGFGGQVSRYAPARLPSHRGSAASRPAQVSDRS